MSCERFDAALRDGALGATMGPDVESHVAECPRCRARFADYQRAIVQLDTDLQAALSVEPSLAFQAQIRRRIGDAHRSARLPREWIAAAAAAAAVVVVIAIMGGQSSRRAQDSQVGGTMAAVPRPAEPVQHDPRQVPDGVSSATAQAHRPPTAFRAVRARVNRPRPEVLVPRSRAEDLQRFLTSVKDGRFHLPADVDLPAAIGFGDGNVPPLLIRPIPVAPLELRETPVQAISDLDKGADRD
jgi:hypothetical protein